MLIFYYGLLFLGTLSITDGVATFILIALIDFFIGKTIWQDYEPFVSWRKKKYKQLIKLKKQAKKSFLKKWEKAPLLKRAYIIVAGLVGFALLILFVHLYLEILLFNWNTTETTAKEDSSIRNLAIAFLGTVSGIGALFGVYLAILRSEENTRQNKIANDQNEITEQGLITDRINKAVEGLGKSGKDGDPVIEVRIGALLALERIAQDSIRDHIQILEIICSYIRHNTPLPKKPDTEKDPIDNTGVKAKRRKNEGEAIDGDIQTAINIIGRRDKWSEGIKRLKKETNENYILDLSRCNLSFADFNEANLENVWFSYTYLCNAAFFWVKMPHVSISGANLSNVWIRNTDMSHVNFSNTITKDILAYKINFSECESLTQSQLDAMFCQWEANIPNGSPPKHWPKKAAYDGFDGFATAYWHWKDTRE